MTAWGGNCQSATFVAVRWVCEDHPDKAWDGASDRADACHCGGAGLPCLACNPCDHDHPPEMPPGYRSLIDKDSPD